MWRGGNRTVNTPQIIFISIGGKLINISTQHINRTITLHTWCFITLPIPGLAPSGPPCQTTLFVDEFRLACLRYVDILARVNGLAWHPRT